MIVYLRRKQLMLCSVAHTNIPLRLPLRNVIRKSSIHPRSIVASVPLVLAKAREGAGTWQLLRRCTVAAVVPLVLAKAREGARGWLPRRRCTVAAVVPLVPDKAREGSWGWILRRRCTVAAVVLLVPNKAREGPWGWLLRRRCTVAAVVPLVPDKAREGAWGWLLRRRQCCTVTAAIASHKRFRAITMTTTVLRRRTRDIIAGPPLRPLYDGGDTGKSYNGIS